jgi:hypothetical protein
MRGDFVQCGLRVTHELLHRDGFAVTRREAVNRSEGSAVSGHGFSDTSGFHQDIGFPDQPRFPAGSVCHRQLDSSEGAIVVLSFDLQRDCVVDQ